MLKPFRLGIVRIFFNLIPVSRFFRLKNLLLRWAGGQIEAGVRIYSSVKIYGNGKLVIGENTFIGHDVRIFSAAPGAVEIGANVDIAPLVFLGTGSHQIDPAGIRVAGEGVSRSIVIKDGAWIGAASIILGGVTIGSHAVVGAGSMVNKKVEPRTIVGGVPAKHIGLVDEKPGK